MEKFVPGGYSSFRPLTPTETKFFEDVIRTVDGIVCVPLAVATQVVAGTNYDFLCLSNVVGLKEYYNSLVSIYQPPTEKPSITSIRRIEIR